MFTDCQMTMLRVGYPANIAAELLRRFPEGVELIPLSRKARSRDRYRGLDSRSLSHAGQRIVPASAWREAGSFTDGGNGVDSRGDGPHVTICNARGAHNVSTAEWTITAILTMLKYFPLFLDVQRSGDWKRRFEATAALRSITGDTRPQYPPVMLEELTGKTVLLVGYGAIGKEIERMLEPFRVELMRVARTARATIRKSIRSRTGCLLPQARSSS